MAILFGVKILLTQYSVKEWIAIGITAVITGLGIAVAILGSGYFLIRRALADEQDKKQWNGRIITCVVSGIGVAIVSSLVGYSRLLYRWLICTLKLRFISSKKADL